MKFSWRMVLVSAILGMVALAPTVQSSCFPAIFNFGDSTSDTGGIHASFPTTTPAEYPPYGETYFVSPRVRYSDGRLLIDYIATGLGLNFLSPYLQSVLSNFGQGANFATAGATVQDVTYLSPFTLTYQVKQFQEFYTNVQTMINSGQGGGRLPSDMSIFSNALYTIAIGGNDFTYGYTRGLAPSQVEQYLPNVVQGIVSAIQNIYNYGGRYFVVWDIEPQGCLPYMLTLIQHSSSDLDANGCLYAYNNAASYYNGLLKSALQSLQGSLSGATIIYFGVYDVKTNLQNNLAQNGFIEGTSACCGVPSAYNYNTKVDCGSSGTVNGVYLQAVTCTDPSQYTIWDGVHNTDAANKYIANQLFSGNYFTPQFDTLVNGCGLNPI